MLIAPVSDVLDLLTLLSLRQHIALLLTLLARLRCVVRVAWPRDARHRRARPPRGPHRRAHRARRARGARASTPSASSCRGRWRRSIPPPTSSRSISIRTPSTRTTDAPTGRRRRARDWHRDAGFDVRLHHRPSHLRGRTRAWANNPAVAGQGTMLLPGIEVGLEGRARERARRRPEVSRHPHRDAPRHRRAGARAGERHSGNEPVLIETFPGDITRMIPAKGPGTAGVRAIEIVDGAPQGLGQTRRERARIIHSPTASTSRSSPAATITAGATPRRGGRCSACPAGATRRPTSSAMPS